MMFLLAGCGWVPPDELLNRDERVQAQALEELAPWQARQIVPLLRQIAEDADDYFVQDNVYGALVRADTEPAEAVLRAHLEWKPATRYHVLSALEQHQSKRSCDLMAELWLTNPEEKAQLEVSLSSANLDEGWPCFQSLKPYRESNPRADEIWRKAATSL